MAFLRKIIRLWDPAKATFLWSASDFGLSPKLVCKRGGGGGPRGGGQDKSGIPLCISGIPLYK